MGMMYVNRSGFSQEEVLKMLKINNKEKEKIKKMYKGNPLLKFISEAILEEEIKKYQELLKQKELEAKLKEELLK